MVYTKSERASFLSVLLLLVAPVLTGHRFSLVETSGGLSLVGVCRLLTAVVPLVAGHRPWEHGLQGAAYGLHHCGASWAYLLHSIWNIPEPGIEPVSLSLTGRLLPTAPPWKSRKYF